MKFNFQEFFKTESKKPYFIELQEFLKKEKRQIVPQKEDIYRAFDMDWDNLKVIIIGQDPYYNPLVADGLAFSTRQTKTPSSLKNIFKEIKQNYSDANFETNSLDYWKSQGVLLVNTTLTTVLGLALAHKNIGWETFVSNLLCEIVSKKQDIIFMLFGNKAVNFVKNIDLSRQFILQASHPSGLSCHRGFLGSQIFLKANTLLKTISQKPIDWSTKKVD